MNYQPHEAALKAARIATKHYHGHLVPCRECAEKAWMIQDIYAGLVGAAEEVFAAEESGSFAHMSHAKAQLRAELARVKGES